MILEKLNETKSFISFREVTTDTVIDVQKHLFERAVAELRHWDYHPEATNFSVALFNLIAKADMENSKKLLTGFPNRMAAYLLWMQSPDKDKFYEKYLNITKRSENED